ncbi:hypothetical protein F2Q70_00040978 [Brassica cretica]|uniref:Uncharacterized protein n=2 Tax=Brassica cretica TaxID=69181 RepID=A0A8S9K4J7_BRACR|nr:hypothetical protein F2Q70_00040978 [Brassica cretica]
MNEATANPICMNKVRSSLLLEIDQAHARSHVPMLKLTRSSSEGTLFFASSTHEENSFHSGFGGESLPPIVSKVAAMAQPSSILEGESLPPIGTLYSATKEAVTESLLRFGSVDANTTVLESSPLVVDPKADFSATPGSILQEETEERLMESDCTKDTPSSQFVPSLGSWANPLIFKPPVTPPEPSTPKGYDPMIVGNQLAALWSSLNDEILNKKPKSKFPSRSLQLPIDKLPPPELKTDGTLRFPWAARLSPQSRNLFQAATSTYRLDGTPEVSIPSKVLRLGPENKD